MNKPAPLKEVLCDIAEEFGKLVGVLIFFICLPFLLLFWVFLNVWHLGVMIKYKLIGFKK